VPGVICVPSAACASAALAAAPFFFPRWYAQNASAAIARTTSATPTPIPASAPGERELPVDAAIMPVPVGEAELLVCVTGLRLSVGAEEVEEPAEEEELVLEDVVVEELLAADVEEEAEFWTMLHLTVVLWLKLFGH
jgi:hypothetical protein